MISLLKELNVDVGNGNFVKKSIPETKELIEEQIKKLGQIKEELEQNLKQLGEELTKMMDDIQSRQDLHEHSHSHEKD